MLKMWFHPQKISSLVTEIELLSRTGHKFRCEVLVYVKSNDWGMPSSFLLAYRPLSKSSIPTLAEL